MPISAASSRCLRGARLARAFSSSANHSSSTSKTGAAGRRGSRRHRLVRVGDDVAAGRRDRAALGSSANQSLSTSNTEFGAPPSLVAAGRRPGDRGSAAPDAWPSGGDGLRATAGAPGAGRPGADRANRTRRRACRDSRRGPSPVVPPSTEGASGSRPVPGAARPTTDAVCGSRGGGAATAAAPSCRPVVSGRRHQASRRRGRRASLRPSNSRTRLITAVGSNGFSITPRAPLALSRAASTDSNAPDNSSTGTSAQRLDCLACTAPARSHWSAAAWCRPARCRAASPPSRRWPAGHRDTVTT